MLNELHLQSHSTAHYKHFTIQATYILCFFLHIGLFSNLYTHTYDTMGGAAQFEVQYLAQGHLADRSQEANHSNFWPALPPEPQLPQVKALISPNKFMTRYLQCKGEERPSNQLPANYLWTLVTSYYWMAFSGWETASVFVPRPSNNKHYLMVL